MKNIVVAILFIAIVLGVSVLFWQNSASMPHAEYTNEARGFSFKYPDTYELQEREVGNGERGHYAIVLINKTDLPLPVDGEGPPAITVDIFQNNLDNLSLQDWLQTGQSNFKLGPGTAETASVDGKEAVSYSWSGLYEGTSTAFLHGSDIYMVSVTYFTREDLIIKDYKDLLSSIKLRK